MTKKSKKPKIAGYSKALGTYILEPHPKKGGLITQEQADEAVRKYFESKK